MKKLIILSCCLLLAACSLDEDPRDQITDKVAYRTATDVYRNAVATLYTYIGGSADGEGLQGTCRGIYDLQTFGSDEAMLPTRGTDWYDGGIWQQMYCHSWDPGHELLKRSWLYLYKVITLCNRSLKVIADHGQLLSQSQRDEYTAEVRAIRAMYYWYLLDLFGNVPLITATDESLQDLTTSPRRTVFRFVVDELQSALPMLRNANSVQQGDDYGRVTIPVALFVLAKLMLNAEVYTGTPMWEETIAYCDFIENFGFTLHPDYEANFAIHNESSCENIFTIPMDKGLFSSQQQNIFRSLHYRHAAAYGFSGENGTCATKKVLDVFGYDSREIDVRFYYNYWWGTLTDLNGDTILDRVGRPLVYYPREVKLDLSGSPYVETAGARMKKYEVDKNAIMDGKLMENDIVLFRYADVLLMRAEAKLRLGLDGQDDFNAVRRRVGMPLRPLTLDNLLDERLMELCWEGWRRQDLIRFGKYKTLYTGETDEPIIDESDGHTTLFPIPADVMTQIPGLEQNPGY